MAISNNRLREFSDEVVTFAWKDYRHESRNKTMRFDAHEFIRRFLLHVLPSGFQRIRHYGLLANRYREVRLNQRRDLLGTCWRHQRWWWRRSMLSYRDRYQRLTCVSLHDCPHCGRGQMVRIETLLPGTLPRGLPPLHHEPIFGHIHHRFSVGLSKR